MKTRTQFDKFMDSIIKKENDAREKTVRQPNEPQESPQRKYRRLYAERWQNRIKWGRRSE
jgi:hypothetical protein